MKNLLVLAGMFCLPHVAAADPFDAIRSNDPAQLSTLTPDTVNARDRNGVTPLQYAAAMGTLDAMRALIARGADVNAADKGGATALLWAACDPDRVALLLAHGARADAKTNGGRTPLMAASACEQAAGAVNLLLAKGADSNAVAADGQSPLVEAAFSGGPSIARQLLAAGARADVADAGGFTALMGAVGWDDVELVRTLLARGARVNAANTFAGKVVHGDIQLKKLTALMMAVPFGSPALVRLLLDAGAGVNDRDGRGMTPLQFAVASSRQDVRVVRLLLARGADVNAVSTAGETALDWARKFGSRDVLAALEKAGAKGSPLPPAPVRQSPPLAPRAAAEKSLGLLQKAADSFFAASNCVACHHQPMAALAVSAARQAGIPVDEPRMASMRRSMGALLAPRPSSILAGQVGPAGTDGLSNSMLALASSGYEPGLLTDSAVAYLAGRQWRDGSWRESPIVARTPLSDSPITMTVYAMRAMQLFANPARKAEIDARIARTREWLAAARPRTSYERAEILLGLHWAGAPANVLRGAASRLIRSQRPDGGWSQLDTLESDAYATGLALRALKESGLPAPDAAQAAGRASQFLLRTQIDDGSWFVRSRAVKLQPYFQSGFPYDHEQWISYVATAHAAIALLR
jgi:ankyrin repeat protein